MDMNQRRLLALRAAAAFRDAWALMDEEYLQDLLFEVAHLEFLREEERRLEQVRVTALAKLSDEEIRVLGIQCAARGTWNLDAGSKW